jgi:hypothetical protein
MPETRRKVDGSFGRVRSALSGVSASRSPPGYDSGHVHQTADRGLRAVAWLSFVWRGW